ncbi:MAG: CCA tRNA nucleotidyltransferase [Lentisphaeria bacterium]
MPKSNKPLPAVSAAERAGDAVIAALRQAGHAAFRVGGCVRDRLLGRSVQDVDVATGATPDVVQALFPRTYAVGAAFGVVVVHADAGVDIEVATFREDADYFDGRRPAAVRFSTLEQDASRRDFTINALFYDPVAAEILDPVGGLADLERGVIRAIGDPVARFREDSLRLLRAVRFAAELGFELDPATAAALTAQAPGLARVSAERVFAELGRMLAGRDPARAFQLLAEHRLLEHWLPEVAAMRGVPQPPEFHPEGDVWEHTLALLRRLHAPSDALAWAALLHDVGKPPTHEWRKGRDAFPNHAHAGTALAAGILRRLHAPGALVEAVSALVASHMTFRDVREMRPATLRRFMGAPGFADALELHRLDCQASHGDCSNHAFLLDTLARYAATPVLPPPLLRGQDLIDAGATPGPRFREILEEARDLQLNGELSDRDQALHWLAGRLPRP